MYQHKCKEKVDEPYIIPNISIVHSFMDGHSVFDVNKVLMINFSNFMQALYLASRVRIKKLQTYMPVI